MTITEHLAGAVPLPVLGQPIDVLRINEVFGPTVQGEGSAAGRHCLFVRLFGCNLTCRWCDTPQTWATTPAKAAKHHTGRQYDQAAERHDMSATDVLGHLAALWPIHETPTMVVVSGGEPLMQRDQLFPLVAGLVQLDCPVHIETAGTLWAGPALVDLVTQFNISPKLDHAGNRTKTALNVPVLERFARLDHSWFKFVVTEPGDLAQVDALAALAGIRPDRIMVMPEGTNTARNEQVARAVIDDALARGYGMSPRWHIHLWGNKRGH